MEIILIRDVDNLGLTGQVLKVAPGYARNFLLPTGAALPASPGNLKMLARKRAEFEARARAEKEQAATLKNRLADLRLSFRRKAGEKGKLYGAVTAMDLAEALKANGFDIDRKRLRLSEPVKTLGDFEVPVRLHQDVVASFRVQVLPEDEGRPEGGGQEAPAEKSAPPEAAE
ncbi:MAG: 50S ribosomal protein L9 [Candidatus Adiutrix sp.]|jgi:large subunit ribosomal protein L9|nr:50S ribosomal protein L9 [Candidatus Adiutrix sp.]